jgi:hypothetical protein
MKIITNGRNVLAGTVALAVSAVAVVLANPAAHGTPSTGTGTTTLLSRGTIADQTIINTEAVQLHTFLPTDVAVFHSVVDAGWTSGWHSHHGPVLVAVKSGSLRITTGACSSVTLTAGNVYVERPGVHYQGTALTAAEWYTTMLLPAGAMPKMDQPGACGI